MTAILHPDGQSVDLPGPLDNPNSDLVIFDGNCRFCLDQIERLLRYDRNRQLSFVSLHDPWVSQRFPDLSHSDMMKQMYVVDPNGKKYPGIQAIRYLSARLPGFLWVSFFLNIPFTLPVWDWVYRRVAERRYRLAGGTEC